MSIEEKPEYLFASLHGQNLLQEWDKIEPIIERALEHDYDGMTTSQVLARILLDELTLVVVVRDGEFVAAMTLEYVQRGDRICHCMTFSGSDMEQWCDEWMETWRRIAIDTGCRYLSIKGRKGWSRYAAKHYGFTHAYTQMYYDLNEDNENER